MNLIALASLPNQIIQVLKVAVMNTSTLLKSPAIFKGQAGPPNINCIAEQKVFNKKGRPQRCIARPPTLNMIWEHSFEPERPWSHLGESVCIFIFFYFCSEDSCLSKLSNLRQRKTWGLRPATSFKFQVAACNFWATSSVKRQKWNTILSSSHFIPTTRKETDSNLKLVAGVTWAAFLG